MNKEKFIFGLRNALKENNVADIDNVILKYDNWYDLGLEAGLSDDEIVKKFGSYDDIIKSLNEEVVFNDNNSNNQNEEIVLCDIRDGYSISINMLNESIKINFAEIDFVKIKYDGDLKLDDYVFEYKDAKVSIKRKQISMFKKRNGNMVITLPKLKSISQFSFNTTSGKLDVDILKAIDKISFNSVNADIKCNGLSSNVLKIKTISGKMSFGYIEAESYKINSISGDIEIIEIEAKDGEISNVSGDIVIYETNTNPYAHTISGKLSINDKDIETEINVTKKEFKEFGKKVKDLFKKNDKKDVEEK